jgi:hypothetical protein
MATSASVTVGATATRLDNAAGLSQGQKLIIRNTHATDALILGGPDVVAAAGYALPAGQSITLTREPIYGVRGLDQQHRRWCPEPGQRLAILGTQGPRASESCPGPSVIRGKSSAGADNLRLCAAPARVVL